MKAHPYAELFPFIIGPNLYELRDDIKANGQTDDAHVYDGQLLDGRCRQWCCEQLGIPLKTVEFKGTPQEALAFSISKNLKRRHLGTGERSMIAAKISQMSRKKPNELPSENQKGSKETFSKVTQEQAAKAMNVSTAQVKRAAAVLKSPEATKAVDEKKTSVSAAAKMTVRNKKPGKPMFDNKIISDLMGKIVRASIQRADAFGKSPGYKDMRDKLQALDDAWNRWMKEGK